MATIMHQTAPLPIIDHGMSTDKILKKCFDIFKARFQKTDKGRCLDIGSGRGNLVRQIKAYAPQFEIFCLDHTDSHMLDKSFKLDLVDLDHDKLPYPEKHFDFISCIEVIEHLENFRQTIREAHRVLKPGGTVVFTTPNVLSLKSRIRYFMIGFQSLFSPLDIGLRDKSTQTGHISPISYFFLAHAMAEAGFKNIDIHYDKRQRSAIIPLIFFYPIILLFSWIPIRSEKRKSKLNSQNRKIFNKTNSVRMLTSRTIIVTATRES